MHNLSILGALLELLLHPWGHFKSTLDPFLVFRNALGVIVAPGAPLGALPRNSLTFLEPFWGQFFDIFRQNESFG